jgi:hypothetical protein
LEKVMKYKVSELEGELLDAAVAMAENAGIEPEWIDVSTFEDLAKGSRRMVHGGPGRAHLYSSNWADGGPIIERERILLSPLDGEWRAVHTPSGHNDDAEPFDEYSKSFGPTPRVAAHGHTALIAAMRARVASRFGDEVELP